MALEPTDILEHWDEYTTVQPHRDTDTKREVLVFISRCEICRTQLWRTVKNFDRSIISEERINQRCSCDDMEDELNQFDGDNSPEDTLNTDLPGMWDHSDFLGGRDYDDHPGLTKQEYDDQVAHDKAYHEAMAEEANHHQDR